MIGQNYYKHVLVIGGEDTAVVCSWSFYGSLVGHFSLFHTKLSLNGLNKT